MSLSNTSQTYGAVAKTLHWLTVLLILTAIPLGIIANGAPFETSAELTQKGWLFSLHKTVGVTVFFVALIRILWAISQPKPGAMHPARTLETLAAEVVHWLLYGSLILVPLTGWLHHASTTGFAPILWPFGQGLPFVPISQGLADLTASLHIVFERVLVLAILLHVAGALKHLVIDKDKTLQRMLPGSPELPKIAPHKSSLMPVAGAIVLWGVAIAVGVQVGAFNHANANQPKAVELEAVVSGWTVTDGTLGLEATQFGGPVSGAFSDWTAEINYTPGDTDGVAGDVKVTVAIGSLTLGSVTDQALGPKYLNAEGFPTAIYTAQILRTAGELALEGTLSLKDAEVPVTLPFELSLDGDQATAKGGITLDRRDFGIGPQEDNPGFAVGLTIDLTATRSE